MSSVLHPVGPEPRERYWVRRVAVIVAAIVAIGVVIALVGNAMSAGSAVQAEPAPPTIVPPVVSASPTPGASPGSVSPTASPNPSGTPGATSTASPSPTPTSSSSKSAADKSKTATAKKAAPKKATTKQPVYAACDPSDLRATLTGDRTVKLKKKTTFSLSLINGGKKTCKATVKPSNATLTIVSGGDRIWSTKDCPAAQPTTKRTLLPEHTLAWKVTWSGKRSGDDCSTGKVAPKKGYYWAIASYDGADDVRFRVILG